MCRIGVQVRIRVGWVRKPYPRTASWTLVAPLAKKLFECEPTPANAAYLSSTSGDIACQAYSARSVTAHILLPAITPECFSRQILPFAEGATSAAEGSRSAAFGGGAFSNGSSYYIQTGATVAPHGRGGGGQARTSPLSMMSGRTTRKLPSVA